MFSINKPIILPTLYPSLLWKVDTQEKKVYLTFDDGPTPGVTPWVLDQLKQFNAKATFFCLGKNVQQQPIIYQRILNEGHAVGNHTHNHRRGWTTKSKDYLDNIQTASQYIRSKLFRPPYGMIKTSQILKLRHNYKIIMWNVLSRDYNQKISPEECLHNVINDDKPGSIIVFHDSLKAERNLRYVLPKVLQFYSDKGYSMVSVQ